MFKATLVFFTISCVLIFRIHYSCSMIFWLSYYVLFVCARACAHLFLCLLSRSWYLWFKIKQIIDSTLNEQNKFTAADVIEYNLSNSMIIDVYIYINTTNILLITFYFQNLNKELLSEINKINGRLLTREQRLDLKILRHYVRTFVKGHRWIMWVVL